MPQISPITHVASSTHRFASLHHFTTRFISTPIGVFVAWLTIHTSLAYLVLLVGAYFDALIGPSLFIPGEVVFLGGSILGSQGILNIWIVMACLFLGGMLGDSTSYWIGRFVGKSLLQGKPFFGMKHYHRMQGLVGKFGPQALFFARLVGPFSKIAPVTAGILEIPYPTFLLFNIPGVIVGIGEFIVVGYFFGENYEQVLGLFERYLAVFFAIAAVVGIGVWQYFSHKKRKAKRKHANTHKESAEEHGDYLKDGIL